ncbi:MAG: glycoside hydrolase family 3 C-terminal domain-containing protein [Gammaproteobacteria bacterium]|nr:glycoside hydrolase family 3 C-terminal domain-containing protein [Gammaproteobacteria bacterium]
MDEKVSLVTGTGMEMPGLPPGFQAPVVGVSENARVPGAAGATFAIPRLGIPSMVLADGPAGLRILPHRKEDHHGSYYCTAFPIATLLASSWDIELVEQVGCAMGLEAKEYGVDILLAPALNIHRIPLGGRNFEYYSEDPLVSGKMAAAMVRGVQSQGVGTSIKHYVANNHEWNRNTIDVIADQRALREIYLKGFELAVKEGKPWTVMTSYNKLNGTYTSERSDLLSDILRGQWGFEGLVMTDWFGGRNAVLQLVAGNDLLMPGTARQQKKLLEAVTAEQLDEAVLDRDIENILNVLLKSLVFSGYRYGDDPDLQGNAAIARKAAADGMVLLQNKNQTLPLASNISLGVFGNSSYEMVTGGTGSGDVNKAHSISLVKGLDEAGYTTLAKLEDDYANYLEVESAKLPPRQPFRVPERIPERTVLRDEIIQIAGATDAAIVTLGRNSGEFADREIEDDFNLSAGEQQLLAAVAEAYHQVGKKVVVILNIGGVIETASWRDQVDAILLAWQPGQEAGFAIADVLSGTVSPSGKLATTFAINVADYPSAENFPGVVLEEAEPNGSSLVQAARAAEVVYEDSIWVGYRAFHTRNMETAFPFGHGLSFTRFSYGDLQLSSAVFKDKLSVRVTVTNCGELPGREVVQLYLSAPSGRLDKPASELRAFGKTRLLQPDASQTLDFVLAAMDLASFDPVTGMWTVDAGKYALGIGASSTDIRTTDYFQVVEALSLSV